MNDIILSALNWILDIFANNGIEYQITGGFAVNIYGSTREPYDIDIELSNIKIYWLCNNITEIQQHLITNVHYFEDPHFKLLMCTLSYHGQLIDLCGISNQYLFDGHLWHKQTINLGHSILKSFNNRIINISHPNEILKYKKILKRNVDIIDIEFLEKNT